MHTLGIALTLSVMLYFFIVGSKNILFCQSLEESKMATDSPLKKLLQADYMKAQEAIRKRREEVEARAREQERKDEEEVRHLFANNYYQGLLRAAVSMGKYSHSFFVGSYAAANTLSKLLKEQGLGCIILDSAKASDKEVYVYGWERSG